MTSGDVSGQANASSEARWHWPKMASLLLCFLLLAFGLVRAVGLRWICDDAFVSIRYAENFVNGLGLVYNAGEYVEGYSNFLWTLLLASFMKLGIPAIATAHVLGILAYMALALAMAHWAWRRTRTRRQFLFPLAAALTLMLNDFHVWATGGLETMLFAYLAVQAIMMTRFTNRRSLTPLLVGFLLSLLVLTRLDGLLFAGVGVVSYWIPMNRLSRRVQVRNSLLTLIPVLLTLGIWLPWKWTYYGDIFPTAFYSKSVVKPYYSQGLIYLGLYLAKNWFVVAAPLLLAAAGGLTKELDMRSWGRALRGDSLVFLAAGLLYLVYVTHVGGDFMFARRLIPVVPFLFLALENGLDHHCRSRRQWVLSAIILLMAVAPAPIYNDSRIRIKGIADEPRFYPNEVIEVRKQQAETIGKALAGLDVRVAFEGGMCVFGYYSRLPYLVEMSGLTQYTLAKLPLSQRGHIGHEKGPTGQWFIANNIHFLVKQTYPHQLPEKGTPQVFNEIYFGNVAKARIILYSDEIMDALRQDPTVSFLPIERVLAEATGVIGSSPLETSERLFRAMDDYYFREADDRGKREAQRMLDLIRQKRQNRKSKPPVLAPKPQ